MVACFLEDPMKNLLFAFVLSLLAFQSIFAQNTDIDLLTKLNNHRNTSLDKPLYNFDKSVYPVSLANPIALLGIGLIKNDQDLKQKSLLNSISIISSMGTSFVLKRVINRDRPYVTYPNIQHYNFETDPSMPSGHTTAAFATATSITLAFPKWYVAVPAYTYASLVAYSRLHLGVHYRSDVLLGAIIGSGCSFITYKAQKYLQKKRR